MSSLMSKWANQKLQFEDVGDHKPANEPAKKDPFAGALILVVDDEPTQRILARDALETAGFRVEEAEDGPEAIVKANLVKPDLVILDVMMPGLDGFTVCRELRRLKATRHLPIVLLTGLQDLQSAERGYDVGATDFLVKPIQWPALLLRVRYCLRNHHFFKSYLELLQGKPVQQTDAEI